MNRTTHIVPDGGLQTWSVPDPASSSTGTLPAGAEVLLVERRGDWANVSAANGWSGWVDGRALVEIAAPAASNGPQPGATASLDNLLEPCNRNPWLGALAAGIFSALLASLLWPVLGLPAQAIGGVVPDHFCSSLSPGSSSMWRCSAQAGLMRSAGPIVLIAAGLIFHRPLLGRLRRWRRLVPRNSRFLVGPALATGLFTMAYADVHSDTAGQSGLVGQRTFPAVIGLFAYGIGRVGPALAARGERFFAARDRVPGVLRVALVVAVPMLFAYQLNQQNRVTMTAQKEQQVILVTLVGAAVALVPRSGNLRDARLPRLWRGGVPDITRPAGTAIGQLSSAGRPGPATTHPSAATESWSPTHVIPPGGLNAWDRPDPAAPMVAVDPGVEVVVTQTSGDWANIRAVNGWTGWVDGHQLLALGGPE